MTSTVITVWDGLPQNLCRHVNGRIVLYRVQYTEVASGVVQSKDEPGEWNIRNVVTSLTGLIPFTNYSIQIAAVNEEGDVGPYTDPITRQTGEDSESVIAELNPPPLLSPSISYSCTLKHCNAWKSICCAVSVRIIGQVHCTFSKHY